MSNEKRSKKILIIATALMIVALGAVIAVYATSILGTFTGGTVTVEQITGAVTYSYSNSAPWDGTLQPYVGSSWYVQLAAGGGYIGSVTVTFQLQQSNGSGGWTNTGTPITTSAITLTGSTQDIYASTDGTITNNFNWGTGLAAGTYQIVATVNSAS
jgi:hypothetical protein